jgi:DNA mismatch repair protein MutS
LTIVTPIMRQYQAVKEQYSDCLLFFRLGDFYEMFADDAILASHELNIVLTARDGGGGQKIPMCGVPHHAATNYIARLIEKGYKIAVCEQMEDPKSVKGLVKREVVRVITPGTVLEEIMLEGKANNYLAACWLERKNKAEASFSLAYTDISTGKFFATEISGGDIRDKLADELARIAPAELLLPDDLMQDELFHLRLQGDCVGCLTPSPDINYVRRNFAEILQIHFGVANLEGLGLAEYPQAALASAMIINYLLQTQKRSLQYIDKITLYGSGEYLLLDAATRRNLELVATMRSGKRKGSLLWVIDDTLTAMGGRTLRDWLDNPLLASHAVSLRLDAVEELTLNTPLLAELRGLLKSLHDMPRLITKVSFGSAGPRDLLALKSSLQLQPRIFALLSRMKTPLMMSLLDNLDLLEDIASLIEAAIAEDAPLSARDSGIIRKGYDTEVDELRELSGSARQMLLELEARERARTGIRTLKVGYNKVFGYYIEISKSRLEEAPADYIRKQTLVNGERFITEELKELENKILTAGEKLSTLEARICNEIREKTAAAGPRINRTAEICAHLDALQSLASVALANNYCKPQVDGGGKIIISEGRHPVIEKIIGAENYIPNDTYLDRSSQRMMLITGPNMTGKSTYMRQVALIVLLAHIGSFVPAAAAQIGQIDRIFTRVGASDDLGGGQSTFMVEMTETSNILRHASGNSLIILDEIGRGTSTYDGLSIAWAVAEHIINDDCGAKTLFATHYHELTLLAESFPLIKNYSISVKEKGHDIVFLRKIVEGAADRSYGIQVARLAGLPKEVIRRAKEIMAELEAEKHLQAKLGRQEQITFRDILLGDQPEPEGGEIISAIREMDLDSVSPLDALLQLSEWKKALKDE